MKVEADLDLCIGAGMCALTAPGVFDQRATDGRVVVLVEHPEGEDAEDARRAVAICPSGALSLTEPGDVEHQRSVP
jgi:ferredoxin